MSTALFRQPATRLMSGIVMAAAAWLASLGAGAAADAPRPTGPVILTVAGKIAHANRGPLDPVRDGFFNHHDISFARALQLDRAMLAKLAQGTVRARPHKFERPVTFTGPLLAEILKLAGAAPKTIRLMALDGYAVELGAEALAARTWVLALAADGRPLALGGLGPAWLMHAPAAGVEVSEAEGQRWVWSVFYIEVE